MHDEKRRGQGGDEANAAEGVSEHGAVDVDEKGDERGLVNIAPGEVIAAGNVVELVAEVAVAVVEVDMEEQLGECDEPDDQHAAGEERSVVAAGRGEVVEAVDTPKKNSGKRRGCHGGVFLDQFLEQLLINGGGHEGNLSGEAQTKVTLRGDYSFFALTGL